MSDASPPGPESVFTKAIKSGLLSEQKEAVKMRDLSQGLEWVKRIIDDELNRQIDAKLLTLKLLYAGYFGAKGRNAKYARNPCAIREAINFCRNNGLPPPDWTLPYIYDLLSGQAEPPSESDERRWTNLMKLLDIAAEWDKKNQEGLSEAQIESYFHRKGVSDKAIKYARSFTNPDAKQAVSDFAKRFTAVKNTANDYMAKVKKEVASI